MNTTASSSSISSRSTLKSDDKNSNVTAAAPSPIFSLSSGDVRRHEPSASSPQHCHHQYTNMFVPPTLSSLHLPNLMRNRPKPNPSQSVAIKRSVPIVLIHRNASSPLSRYIKWRQLHQPQAMSTSPSASISSLTSSSSSTISSPIQTIIEQSNNSTKNNGSSSMNMDQANNMLPINRATSELSLSNLNSSITPPPIHRPRPSNNRLISKSTLPDVETLTENDNSEDEEFPVFSDLSGLSKVAKQLFPDLPASIKTSSSNLSLPLRKSPLTTPSYLTAGMDMFYDDRNPFLVMGNNSSRPAPENNQFSKQIAPPIYFEESSSESDNNKNPSNLLQSNSSSSGPPKLKQMKRTRDVIAEERWEKLPRKQKVHDSPSQRGLDFKPNNKNKISRAFIGGTDSAVGTTQKRKNREGGTNISPTDSPASTDRLRKKLNANKSPPASRNHRQQVQKQQTSSVKRRRKARSSTSSSTSSSSSSRRHSPSSQRKSRKTKDGKRKLVKRRKKTTQRLNNDDQDDSVSEISASFESLSSEEIDRLHEKRAAEYFWCTPCCKHVHKDEFAASQLKIAKEIGQAMCLKHYRPGQGYDPHFHRAGETVVGDTKMDETTTDGDEDDDEDDEKEERVNARHFEKLVVQKIQLGMRRLVENEDAEKVAKAFDRRYGTVLEEMASSSDRNGEGTNTDAGEKEERDVEDLDEVGVVAASLPYHNNNYAPFASSSIMKSNANATKIPQHYRKQRPKFSIKSARNTRPIAIPRSGKIIPGFITKSFPNHSVNPKSTSTIQDLSSIEEEQQKTFSLLIKKQPEIIKQESNHSTLSRSSSSRSSLVLDLLDEFPVSLTILTSGPYSGKSFRWVNENQPLYCQRLIRGKQQAASSPIKLKATAAGYDGSETSFRNWLLKEHGLEDLT